MVGELPQPAGGRRAAGGHRLSRPRARAGGPGTWSAHDIVGHLLHGEATNWLPRARMILQHGTGRAFEPFDRVAMLSQEREPAAVLLGRFQAARQASPPGAAVGRHIRGTPLTYHL